MTRIAPVNLMYSPKTLWFKADGFEIPVGEHVVVTTARGVEFGTVADPLFEATEEQLHSLKSELKPVIRVATEADCETAEAMAQKNLDTMPAFREVVAEEGIDMRPISIEFLLEGDKAIFYFEADERVDFRELVRKLAAKLHVRIEMRQIGVRDEARLIGGLGHCGQELCCKRLGGEFNPVSIRMAKEQNLSLNPEKISGLCGRLMCCLRYEYDAYKDFHGRCPKVGAAIKTPDGEAKVSDLDVPREIVVLKTSEGKTVKVPLAQMKTESGAERPNAVDRKAWDVATGIGALSGDVAAMFLTSQFVGEDKLADNSAAGAAARRRRGAKAAAAHAGGGARQAQAQGAAARNAKLHDAGAAEEERSSKRRPRRRRGGRGNDAGASVQVSSQEAAVQASRATASEEPKASARPGRNSSALRAAHEDAARVSGDGQAAAAGSRMAGDGQAAGAAAAGSHGSGEQESRGRSRRNRRGRGRGNQQARTGAEAAHSGNEAAGTQASRGGQAQTGGQSRQAGGQSQSGQSQPTTVNVNRARRSRRSRTISPSSDQ